MGLNDQIAQAKLNSGFSPSYKTFVPKQYSSKQHEYYNDITRTFHQEYAQYSSDYVEAEVQGLDPDYPFEYTKCHLRLAEIVKPSGSIEGNFDSYKFVMMVERQYEYLRKGAKIKTMGNTWLVLNPANMSNGDSAVIQRCDVNWNYLDYYGNVCHEPMAIDTLLMRASTPDSQRSTMITKGYFNAMIQYNEATKQLFTNSRIIMGSSAYILTGFSDFIQEFTDEPDTINLMRFALRYEEPNDAIDDMVNRVAGGKTFGWDITISGEAILNAGDTSQYTASSVRTSEAKTEMVVPTEEHPVDYIWTSSNPDVATIDENGLVTAVSAGMTSIRATLAQNESKYQDFDLLVEDIDTTPHVAFTRTYPEAITYGTTLELTAAYYENGIATDEPVEWRIEGGDTEAYTFTVDGNTAYLKCWGGSVEPVNIYAEYDGHGVVTTIYLEGI